MLEKSTVLESFNTLPEKFEFDVAMEKLLILNRISIAENQIANGEFVEDSEVDEIIESWFE